MQRQTKPFKLIELLLISTGLWVVQPAVTFAAPIPAGTPNTTITFNDTTDTVTETTTTSGTGTPPAVTGLSCSGETCTIDVLDPSAAAGSSANGTGLPLYILEPGGSTISDILDAGHQNFLSGVTGGYVVTFQSDTNETTGLGPYVSGDSIVEDGTVQTGFMLVWNNVDGAIIDTATIQFQSDLDPTGRTAVPEPMSIALFGAGLIGFGALRRRKFRTG